MEETWPEITSFVLRFVHSGPPDNAAYRGSILNVQTNQELPFVRWDEAVAFIRRYVALDGELGIGNYALGTNADDETPPSSDRNSSIPNS